MKHRILAIALLGSLGLVVSKPATARPWRVNQVPNGTVASCLTCHVFPGGPRNEFGNTIETYGGSGFLLNGDVQWGTMALSASPGAPPKTLAQIDSDADGRSNGDELLDPTDVWRTGQPHPGNPALVRLPAKADSAIVIRQLYVAGGAAGATFQNDFVELYNRGSQPVSMGGWSIQYASASGSDNWGSGPSTLTVFPSFTLQPGQSYLVQEASGGGNGAALPQRDVVGGIAFGDSGGSVVLVNDGVSLGCNGFPNSCSAAALGKIVDLVGYGNSPSFEGLAASVAPPSHRALIRARNGCTDVNSNGNNPAFPEVTGDLALAAAAERGSSSAPSVCGAAARTPALSPFWLWILVLSLAGLGLWARGGLRLPRRGVA